jgi:hypothetical protein
MRLFTIALCFIGVLADEICYYYQQCDMGCFTDEAPWGNTEARPTANLPLTPSDVNTKFHLDTVELKNQEKETKFSHLLFEKMNNLMKRLSLVIFL